MVNRNILVLLSAAFTLTAAAPIEKRIAQSIAEATKDWEQACVCRITSLNPNKDTHFLF